VCEQDEEITKPLSRIHCHSRPNRALLTFELSEDDTLDIISDSVIASWSFFRRKFVIRAIVLSAQNIRFLRAIQVQVIDFTYAWTFLALFVP